MRVPKSGEGKGYEHLVVDGSEITICRATSEGRAVAIAIALNRQSDASLKGVP